jgi:hypothetical protein
MVDASQEDPRVHHTVRSLPPITLRLPIALRHTLEAQAAAAGHSMNAHLTHLLSGAITPTSTDACQVQVPLDADLYQWLDTLRGGDEDMGAGIAQLLAQLHELMQDRLPDLVLVSLPDELQAWLARQPRYESRGREQTILALLRRASQRPG